MFTAYLNRRDAVIGRSGWEIGAAPEFHFLSLLSRMVTVVEPHQGPHQGR